MSDVPLKDIVDLILQVKVGAYVIEGANPRHEHEWKVWKDVKLGAGQVLIPGVISHATHVVVQRLLVTLEGEQIIAALVDHLLGDLALAAHRVRGDGSALQRQQFQGLRHGDDLVRFVANSKLTQNQPLLGCPGADQM